LITCVYNRGLPYTKNKKEMERGKYDSYFDDLLGNFVTLRIVNYLMHGGKTLCLAT